MENGERLHDLIQSHTGIKRNHLRITNGYREIHPTKEIENWKIGEQFTIKLRILGGARDT